METTLLVKLILTSLLDPFPEGPLQTGLSGCVGDGRVTPEGRDQDSSFLREPPGSARSGRTADGG